HLAEEIALPQRGLLAVPREREEQLGLERGPGAPAVEVREEWILPFVQHHGRVEPRAEPIRERRLADAERTFDRDVAELFHRVREYSRHRQTQTNLRLISCGACSESI